MGCVRACITTILLIAWMAATANAGTDHQIGVELRGTSRLTPHEISVLGDGYVAIPDKAHADVLVVHTNQDELVGRIVLTAHTEGGVSVNLSIDRLDESGKPLEGGLLLQFSQAVGQAQTVIPLRIPWTFNRGVCRLTVEIFENDQLIIGGSRKFSR